MLYSLIQIQHLLQSSTYYKAGLLFGGHVFIAEQINGKTVFCDPQSASCQGVSIDARTNFGNYNGQIDSCKPKRVRVCVPRYLKGGREALISECDNCSDTDAVKNSYVDTNVSVLPQDMRIMRIDNLKMTDRIMECCENRS